jgi:hypothetical protein
LLLLDSGNSAALDAGFHKLLKRWEAFVKALEKGNPAALVLFNPHLETEIERTILAEFECLDEEGVGPLLDAIRQAGGRAGRLRKNLANTDELTAAFADRCGSMANVLRRSGYRLSEVNAASEYVEPEMAPGQPLTPLASAVASLGEHALLCYSEIRGLLVGNWSIKDLSAPAGE